MSDVVRTSKHTQDVKYYKFVDNNSKFYIICLNRQISTTPVSHIKMHDAIAVEMRTANHIFYRVENEQRIAQH